MTDDLASTPDPILLEVMKGEFLTVVEEMCAVIGRTARSFGARDGGDYTGAVIHPNGQVVARAGVSAWYVGNSVPFILDKFGGSFKPGDIVIHNDPYSGGTHLPDIVLLMPVFHDGQPIAYVGNSVHHTDLGGFAPGGMSAQPTELFQEGLLLPRVLLYDGGQPVSQVFEIIKANTRSPVDVIGDLESQVAGCITAGRDIERLVHRYGLQTILDYGRHIVSYSEQAVRNAIRSIPDGRYTVDMDASGEDDLPPVKVVLTVEVDGDAMTCDFSGTDAQSPSAVNVPPSTVAGNLLGNFHELFGIDVPANSGLLTPIQLVAPEGTVVNPRPPAAVGARSTITNKLSDLLLNALAQAMPDRVRAEGPPPQMIVFTPDSDDGTSDEMLFDLWLAGTGARPNLDGLDGPVGFRRIPAETMERDAHVVLEGYGMVPDTGGAGRFRGGLALYRQWRFLSPGRLWLRHLYAGKQPQGRLGGHPGSASVLVARVGGEVVDYSHRYGGLIRVQPGDAVYQASAGGGGHGDPLEREPRTVADDVRDEKVSRQAAETVYGVILTDDLEIDVTATGRRRRQAGLELRARDAMNDDAVSNVRQLRELAVGRPTDTAYVHLAMDGTDRVVTWSEVERRSDEVGAALAARGVGYGDRVGLGIRNSPEFLFAVFGTWKLGAVPIPVRWDVPDWELQRLKEVIRPRLYISPNDLPWIFGTDGEPGPARAEVVSPNSYGICSSGSTGTPKVILSDAPAVFNPVFAVPFAEVLGMAVTRPQRILVLAPMYHVNAFATLTNMLGGDQLYVIEKFDAARIVAAIERYRITTFTATPTMLQRVADLPGVDDRDLSSLEWILQGAAPMPPSLVHRWGKLIGYEKIILAYGSTEGLGLTVLTGTEYVDHSGSVGRGFAGAEVKILDDGGQEVPVGQIGNIYVRSPNYRGVTYLGQAPQIPMTPEGFGTVGDLGYVDDEGYLYLADRRVDLIVTGGANVFPAEVEAALIDHPNIADVVVIGLKDPEWGRRVHAIIEPADPADPPSFEEVRQYVRSRLLPYKVPKSIEIVDAVPRSEAMKVNRGRLVEGRGG